MLVKHKDLVAQIDAEILHITGRGDIAVIKQKDIEVLRALGFPDNPFLWLVDNREVRAVETMRPGATAYGLVLSGKK